MAENLFIWSIIGFFGGIFLFFKGFSWLRLKHLIENIPTSKIRSVAMGLSEICGDAVPLKGKILRSPFSNKDCVYCRYTIQEYRSSGKHSRWVTVKSDENRVHFNLRDNTGVVLVDPKGAKIDIPLDYTYNSGVGKDPPANIQNFLKNNRMGFEGLFGINKTMRYREYFIAPKDKLYVLGTAMDNPFVEEGSSVKGVEDLMIGKGKNSKIYYISDKPEKEVLKSFRAKAIGGVLGGSALAVASLVIALFYLNLL